MQGMIEATISLELNATQKKVAVSVFSLVSFLLPTLPPIWNASGLCSGLAKWVNYGTREEAVDCANAFCA